MRKITLSLLSLLFAMFLFVACDNAPKATEEDEDATAVEEVVLEVADTLAIEVDTTIVVEEVVEEIVD
ncbi:MAG: hypothetical protein PF487_10425 [Bacteroidales bacterium]|jgi:uncharacterized lipoprotein YajG|nr:hypothetical protein [Bacteroidales bacterium]